MIYNLISYFNL